MEKKPIEPVEERLITERELREQYVDLPRSTVYALADHGDLPSYKIGARHLRFKPSEIRAWLASKKRPAAK